MNFFLAASLVPFAAFLLLLLAMKARLVHAAFVAWTTMAVVALVLWRVPWTIAGAASIKGIAVAMDIFFIIIGAVFFLDVLEKHRIIEHISFRLERISRDYRVRMILLAWFLENFIEGTAGFGTPTAIVAPLLVGMGFPALDAVALSLLGNSASVVFGAAGAPIRVGFSGLAGNSVPFLASLVNIPGMLVPVFMLWFATKEKPDASKSFFEALPFALASGIAYIVSSMLFIGIGQEFPSILGSVLGLVLMLVCVRFGWFMPSRVRMLRPGEEPDSHMSVAAMVAPYASLVGLLILGKALLGSVTLSLPLGVAHTFNLFNPGFAFLATGCGVAYFWRARTKLLLPFAVRDAVAKTAEPFFVIACMSGVTQLMIMSGSNASGLPSILATIGSVFENRFIGFWTPFLGMFGSFVTGSATIANIMFGSVVAYVASHLSMSVDLGLALLVVGGAAGNMVALADMLTAETVVGLRHQEVAILRRVLIPCLMYVGLVGLIGIVFMHP